MNIGNPTKRVRPSQIRNFLKKEKNVTRWSDKGKDLLLNRLICYELELFVDLILNSN
jgi:hypothetical protein